MQEAQKTWSPLHKRQEYFKCISHGTHFLYTLTHKNPVLHYSITNVILFNFFTQTEFSHSKSLLKEIVVKCLEKTGTALVGS